MCVTSTEVNLTHVKVKKEGRGEVRRAGQKAGRKESRGRKTENPLTANSSVTPGPSFSVGEAGQVLRLAGESSEKERIFRRKLTN